MSMSLIEVCTPQEAAALIARMKLTEREERERALAAAEDSGFAFALHGWVDVYFKDARTGKVVDEIHQPNIITDLMRRAFATQFAFVQNFIITSPSTDAALLGRYALCDTGSTTSGQQTAVSVVPTYDANTLTRSWVGSFPTPPGPRKIGTVGLALASGGVVGWSNTKGVQNLGAYTLISPTKTQSTTQTVEVNYRITLTPTT